MVINNVGPAVARRIVTERKIRGLFRSQADIKIRLSLPDRIYESLALA